MKYYNLKNILAKKAKYNLIIGERSNGKTTACLLKGVKDFIDSGQQFAYIRRWREDFTGKRGQMIFGAINEMGVVKKWTHGEWEGIYYKASKWYLGRFEEEKIVLSEIPCCYGFSLSSMEHDKSTNYPEVTNIIFDEFLSRESYLPDEFILFMNVLSTIIRQRDNVTIFMLGNTVNKFCPYFKEMGLKHIEKMEQGSIDLYQYGTSGLTVAVEYCAATKGGKKSDIYFAFDNPRLGLITGGEWELDLYPHCPIKVKPKDIKFIFFIIFDAHIMQCEVVATNQEYFLFIHEKTTPLKSENEDIIFKMDADPRPNFRTNLLKPVDDLGKKILYFFSTNKVFYQSNDVGEVIRNYILNCKK